ncbi:hypothetical protein QEN19_000974 [Hanseniaspora menglaensis]
MLVPPLNYGIVEDHLYRCSKLETLNFSFIENLGLKLIIFLMTEEPSRHFKEFMKLMKIEWVFINPNSYTSITSKDDKTKKPSDSNDNSDHTTGSSPESYSEVTAGVEKSSSMEIDKLFKKTASSYSTNIILQNEYTANNSFFLIHPKVIHKVFNLILDKSNNNILLVDKSALLVGMLRKVQKWHLSSIIDEYRMITGKHKSYNAECFLEFVNIEIIQEKPTAIESYIDEDNTKKLKKEEDEEEDIEKFDKKKEREKQKLKIYQQQAISQLITKELFETNPHNNDTLRLDKNNQTDKKLKVLIDVDLENFDPQVPEYLTNIIINVESETKILAQEAKEKLKEFDEQERWRKEKKKDKDINKYSMKFNKSKQETTQYEYYKSETKNNKSKISKRLTVTNSVSTSVKKTALNNDDNTICTEEVNNGEKKQPFTRSSITFEPLPYNSVDEKIKNDRLTIEYGTCVSNFSYLARETVPHSSSSEKEHFSIENYQRQVVVVRVPIEEKLQEWFIYKRNVWEEENTFENHREIIFI